MSIKKPPGFLDPKTREAWRAWLERHHADADPVKLRLYHKAAGPGSLAYPEAVEEALCFGWIDSKPSKLDERSYLLHFSRRKPGSKWSKANRDRVAALRKAGKMRPAGMAAVETAKRARLWTALDSVRADSLPPDLAKAMAAVPAARDHFEAFPPSSKRIILEWIGNAKTPETRARRIAETVAQAASNRRANHYRQPGDPRA